VDFGLLVEITNRVCPTNYEQTQPHDYIELPSLSKQGISEKAAGLYDSGLSLRQISKQLNKSKTFIRKTLLEAGVALRDSTDVPLVERTQPPRSHYGNPPYGYRSLRGMLIMDAHEIEIVHTIMELWKIGRSYSAIVTILNDNGLKNRRGTSWEHSLVRSIVRRYENRQLNLEKE
jgi:hypothetical protein